MAGAAMKNFRAEDMPGYRSLQGGPTPDTSSSVEESTTEENETVEKAPSGSSADVLRWVGGSKERAEVALESERESSKPRKGLIDGLEELLSK